MKATIRHGGRPRRPLTGLLFCGRCGAQLVARPRQDRTPRYVCPCGRLSILATETEGVVGAAMKHRPGLERVDVMPAARGANQWTAQRLRATWTDGTTTSGAPLCRTSPIPYPALGRIASQRERMKSWQHWNAAAWAAIYDEAGQRLASSRDIHTT